MVEVVRRGLVKRRRPRHSRIRRNAGGNSGNRGGHDPSHWQSGQQRIFAQALSVRRTAEA
jgi:hypothetical protein